MAYEKQTWVNRVVSEGTGQVVEHGTIVSAERLNHLEDGVFNAHEAIPKKTSELIDDVHWLKLNELSTQLYNLNILRLKYVSVLPDVGEEGVLYLVPETAAEDGNAFAEFIYVAEKSQYELLGAAKVDLSGLWSHDDFSIATLAEAEEEIDKNIPSVPGIGGGESIVDTVARLVAFKAEMEAGERQIVIENLEVIE